MKKRKKIKSNGRREFISTSLKGIGGAVFLSQVPKVGDGFPQIVPSTVFGKYAPSNRINIGVIGVGRIAREWDIPGTWKYPEAKIMAVCDLDSKRLEKGRQYVNEYYEKQTGKSYNGTLTYADHEELLANPDIDAVLICTPDHWHAIAAVQAARAGKHIYMEKPSSLTIKGGRFLSDEVYKSGIIFQIGSQQRSLYPWPQFHRACELVRNGRIGDLETIYVGLPGDPPELSKPEEEMPIPKNLNYEKWLGSTPYVKYTENRVHPQNDFSRPGWLRCRQFGAGMITGWGAHHFDTANWGMGTEYTGPVEISCENVVWPSNGGMWDVHGPFKTVNKFANGVTVYASGEYQNGVKFVGSKGWIFVGRGSYSVTADDPKSLSENKKALDASDPKILTSEIGSNEIHLYKSEDQHKNWLDCILSNKQTIAPAEVGHRAGSICLLNSIAMVLKRKLYWDPVKEVFKNDEEANRMLSRSQRWPYQFNPEFNVASKLKKEI